ncbi:hypothetical protein B14911_15665 [Bacillus sp. NRRL B-14911]|nr:hypothetical protein B14911_15665 [Bacillus sp. NRRL B-14911]
MDTFPKNVHERCLARIFWYKMRKTEEDNHETIYHYANIIRHSFSRVPGTGEDGSA